MESYSDLVPFQSEIGNYPIKVTALGGLDEMGKNCYVIEVNEDAFIIEAGFKYPSANIPGVDIIIPDFDYIKKLDECKVAERELQRKALEGFVYARQTEDYPMCGNMDQYTVDYIIAAMYFKTREFESAMKLLPDILVSSSANRRVKEKARDLKDRILAIKASNKAPTEEEMPD